MRIGSCCVHRQPAVAQARLAAQRGGLAAQRGGLAHAAASALPGAAPLRPPAAAAALRCRRRPSRLRPCASRGGSLPEDDGDGADEAESAERGWPTAYRSETSKLVSALVTRQAVKTILHYFEETNGEYNLFLHQYLSDNPIKVDSEGSADEWLATLAARPFLRISDPRRSSTVDSASLAAATKGERDVSPRDVAERIMALRLEIARELTIDVAPERLRLANGEIMRRALARTLSASAPPDADQPGPKP